MKIASTVSHVFGTLLLTLFAGAAGAASLGTITTVAGGGVGDGELATTISLNAPKGVAVDSAGNIFIADTGNARIRKVALDGRISTVFVGSQGQVASVFPLYYTGPTSCPGDMMVDSADNLIVADPCAHVVRKIAANGTASIVAGKGFPSTPADPSGDSGPATSAALYYPTHIALDSLGNLFITEPSKYRIRKVANGVITTFFGGQFPGQNAASIQAGPVVAEGAGGIYVYVTGPYAASLNRLQRIDSSGAMTPVAGDGTRVPSGDGGPALQAGLGAVQGIALDGGGNLLLTFSDRIRRIATNGIIDTVATVGGGDLGPFGGNYLVTSENRVLKIAPPAQTEVVAGNGATIGYLGDGRSALEAGLNAPRSVVVDANGVVYIADSGNHRIRKVDASGKISTVAGTGAKGFSGDGSAATSAQLDTPAGLALDASGNLLIADRGNHRIRRIDASGIIATVAGTGVQGYAGDGGNAINAQLSLPAALALDDAGNLYVVDYDNERVRKVSPSGVISTVAGGGNANPASDGTTPAASIYLEPAGVAIESATGNVFITDNYRSVVLKVGPSGGTRHFAGGGFRSYDGRPATESSLKLPREVAVDAAGNLYIAESGNHKVRKVDSGGVITTLAGITSCQFENCVGGFAGDGGPASAAQLLSPGGLFWDAAGGYLFVADTGNNRVRKIAVAEPMPSQFSIPGQSDVSVSTPIVSAAVTPSGYYGTPSVSISGGDYSIGCTGTFVSTAGTLEPGQSVCVRHTSAAVNNGTVSAQLTVGGRSATFVTTTLIGPGTVAFGATSLDFGLQSMSTTTPSQTIALTNSGSATVTVNNVTASTNFSVTHDCTTLAPGVSCTVSVRFTPGAAGAIEGTIAFQNSNGNWTVAVRGAGEKSLTTHYYRSILRRDPDAAGKAFWDGEAARVASLGANPNEAWFALAMSFYFSPEYAAFKRSDSELVTDLYTTFFNRAPDGAGLAYWIGQLNGGMPREVALAAFMFSPEFVNFTKAIFGDTAARSEVDMVMDFYRGLLARLPDNAGQDHWVKRFRAAQCTTGFTNAFNAVKQEADAISREFTTGAEYIARGRNNAQYVGDLYNAFFRRGGDLPGVKHWIAQLDSGAQTRESLRGLFVATPEYITRVSGIVLQGCLPVTP